MRLPRDIDIDPLAKALDHHAPFAASGGTAYARLVGQDPIAAWMDLMEVVELLCPRWPARSLSIGHRYLL